MAEFPTVNEKCRHGIVLRVYYRTQNSSRFRHLSQWLANIWVILMNHSHKLQSFRLFLVEQQREKLFWAATPSNRKGKKLQTKGFLQMISACFFVVVLSIRLAPIFGLLTSSSFRIERCTFNSCQQLLRTLPKIFSSYRHVTLPLSSAMITRVWSSYQ